MNPASARASAVSCHTDLESMLSAAQAGPVPSGQEAKQAAIIAALTSARDKCAGCIADIDAAAAAMAG